MSRTRARRLAAVAGALLGVTLAALPTSPASADDVMAELSLGINAIAIGSPGKTASLTVSVSSGVLRDAMIGFDTAQADTLIVEAPGEEHRCAFESETYLGCVVAEATPRAPVSLPFTFKIAPGAKPGDSQTLVFRLSGANVEPRFFTFTIRVGASGSDLVVGDTTIADVTPGGVADAAVVMHNAGDLTARGVTLKFQGHEYSGYLTYLDEFSNCVVRAGFPVCVFPDAVLEPGTAYQLSEPLRFRVGAHTPWPFGTSATYYLLPGANPVAPADRQPVEGRQLRLVARGAVPPAPSDVDPGDNMGELLVRTTRNPADLSVNGATLSGKVGQSLPFTVRITNHGPANTENRSYGHAGTLVVTAPSGTVFSEVAHDDCVPVIDGKLDWSKANQPGHRVYHCGIAAGALLVGQPTTRKFAVQIKEQTVGKDGEIEVLPGGVPDDNRANNKVALDVTVTPGSSPSASPSVTPSSGGGGSGDGGPLPKTGVSLPVYAAVGASLIAVGGVLYLAARRRRAAATGNGD